MIRIITISALPGYRLQVEFEAGVSGTIDLSSDLFGPMFEPLKDEALFGQVRLDPSYAARTAGQKSRDSDVRFRPWDAQMLKGLL